MLAGKHLFTNYTSKILLAGLILSGVSSCTIVKNYPKNKPYVYQTNINVISDMPRDEKDLLMDRLENQLDDSMNPRSVNKVLWKVMKNPPAYDPANADKSVLFMRSLLVSLGYFYDSTSYRIAIDSTDSADGKFPTKVTFDVKPGVITRIDSFWFNMRDSNLQKLTLNNAKESLVKSGDPFAKGPISLELDRLVELYRNNGYLRFNREELIGLWDTLDIRLLEPSLDPFEQIEILQRLKERKEKPTANLEIRLRPGYDSSKLVRYYVGNVNLYPDYIADTVGRQRKIVEVDTGLYIIQYGNKFKPKIFPINVYLIHGELYRQRRYQRTINRFNNIGAWKLINVQANPRPDQDTVDFNIYLTPSSKHLFTANLEASQNQSPVAGNLVGFGVNLGVQNRNFARAANLANTNGRFGIELGSKFIQTQQVSFSHNISFPRPVIFFKKWIFGKLIRESMQDNIRTLFSFNAANTERRELYNLTTINGSWGYEFQRAVPGTNKASQITWRVPNIEYSYLKKRKGLDDLIASNPALQNIFTDGFVASTIIGYTRTNATKRNQHVFSVNFEHSPLLAGFIPSKFLDTNLYRFTKLSVEYTHLIKIRRAGIALRAFGGVGYESPNTKNPLKRNNLPFFKQYFAGGPNSMRAWRLRTLGPGSVIKDFTTNPERYGDVQLEFNAEYRFPLANFAGVRLEGAFFTDVGNIWFLKKEAGLTEEVFNFGRLFEDLGVGVGTGLRIDFTFFLVRVDYAFKAKDPSPDFENQASQNKWFHNIKLMDGQLQIGINYPFKL